MRPDHGRIGTEGRGRAPVHSQVLAPCIAVPIASRLKPKEDPMYLSVGVVLAIILVLAPPIFWVAWWLLADLAERASGSYITVHPMTTAVSRRRAA
jgi:hypothetical protein